MKRALGAVCCLATFLAVQAARASTISSCTTTASGAISCTGIAGTPEDVFLETLTLTGSTNITVQTYGFGGGTNAAGTMVSAGGFDSLVALFDDTGNILMDASGNPVASADNLSGLFSPGCLPAGTVSIGIQSICGDNTLTATLGPGTYTLLLSDANYVPYAVNPGPPASSLLSDGYGDLTGGVFQTCNDQGDCIAPTGHFAVDILGIPPVNSSVPEPGTLALLGFSMAVLVSIRRKTVLV